MTTAVAPACRLDISVEGLNVSSLADSGSQSSIISLACIQKVFGHMRKSGRTPPDEATVKLRGVGGNFIDVLAQVPLILSVESQVATVPVFIENSKQCEFLVGTNALPTLGISMKTEQGNSLLGLARDEGQEKISHMNLVQATTVPFEPDHELEGDVMFEPEYSELMKLGLCSQDSVLIVKPDGTVMVPVQNYQGTAVSLEQGCRLGRLSSYSSELKPEGEAQSCHVKMDPIERTHDCSFIGLSYFRL